jgi:hypothetical protein
MKEKRRSERINLLGTGWLHLNGAQYSCRLENISLHGARVGLKKTSIGPIHTGEACCLRLYQGDDGQHYGDFKAQIVHLESAVAGLEFVEVEGASKEVLENIINKEQHFHKGADKIINLAWEVAGLQGIDLTCLYFDKGELDPEREMHTLRFFAGDCATRVHLHRADMEEFYVQDGTTPVRTEILRAIDKLHA